LEVVEGGSGGSDGGTAVALGVVVVVMGGWSVGHTVPPSACSVQLYTR
jgi:hypothetical protein